MFWVAGNLFHIAWNGNLELWILNPIANMPIAHGLWDPHLGSYLSVVYSSSSSDSAVVIAFSGLYNWLYVSGFKDAYHVYNFSMLCELLAVFFLVLGNLHFLSKEDMFQVAHLSLLKVGASYIIRLLLACIDATGLRLNFHNGAMIGFFSISWCGHLVHVAIAASRGYTAFSKPIPDGLNSFYSAKWSLTSHLLTFLGGLNPETSSIYLTDLAHHHIAVGVLFVWSGHIYSSFFKGFAHRLRDILFVNGNSGLTILSHGKSLHLQLSLACAGLSVITSVVAQHIYSLSPYPYWTYDTLTLVSNYVHHSWIASGLMMGSFAHGSLFLIRDFTKTGPQAGGVIYRVLELKAAILSHLSWLCLWIGFHLLCLYIHNDTVTAFGEPDKQLLIEPVFAQVLQGSSGKALYGLGANETFGSFLLPLGPGDLLAHHAISLALHVTSLIALKGSLDSRGSKLMPDKLHFGFGYACDGPGRGGTCDLSAWDTLYLAVFWSLNACAWIIFYFHWKHLSLNAISQFNESSTFLNGWFRDYLWFNSAALIRGYDSLGSNTALSVWAWAFLGAHLCWATGFMFLISWRGYWQELIETLLYMHLKCPKLSNIWSGYFSTPVALSILQARFIGVVHFVLGFIVSYSSFLFGAR
jgi:photosystem I P700 chlorophyll a apoprotein A2